MMDFSSHRAMFIDFGVDPTAVGRMYLSELRELSASMHSRRGKVDLPSEEEKIEGLEAFSDFVSMDPTVRMN